MIPTEMSPDVSEDQSSNRVALSCRHPMVSVALTNNHSVACCGAYRVSESRR